MLSKLNRETASIKHNLPVKVMQFGDGNFMRGFMDWIIDQLNEKTDFNGSVQIIRPLRKNKEDRPFQQEGLYYVVQKGLLNGKLISSTRLITCITEAINPYIEFQRFLKASENQNLQFIISNTTEAGIIFNPDDKDIYTLPESFPGKVTLLLFHRYTYFKKDLNRGLIFIPCELIEKNGETLKRTILQYVDHWSLPDDFKEWINQCNTFCNTLVDRIVPGFPKDSITEIQQTIGFEDNQLVMCEPYYSLVIEAPEHVKEFFPAQQAHLHVQFVEDVTPYRIRKVRILNGAHTTLVPIAYLRGLRTVKEAMDDHFVNEFIRLTIDEEIIPTIDLPENELKQFAADVLERFQNPFIRHELISIALNSISKFKVRVLPTILDFHERTGNLPMRLLQYMAALFVFYRGSWKGEKIPLQDSPEVLSFFNEVWSLSTTEETVMKILSNTSLWGKDLTSIPRLQQIVLDHVKKFLAP